MADEEFGPRNGGPPVHHVSTASDEILQRYRHIERQTDALGRVIGVRRLRPSEQAKIVGMTPDLGGYDTLPSTDDSNITRLVRFSQRMPLMMAASVVEIDGNPYGFPRSRAELDDMLDRLDGEGMEAIVAAATRLGEHHIAEAARREAAKNLSGTRTSA